MTFIYKDPLSIGFEDLFLKLSSNKTTNFPPYNIIKESDTKYTIEIAIAGYTKEELSIIVEDRVLKVSGTKKEDSEISYVYKGISSKSFTRSFNIADTIEVKTSTYNDGILTIILENNIPEQKKVKAIKIV